MASIPKILFNILDELEDKDLSNFQWHLYQSVTKVHIPKAKIKGKNREETVDVLVQTFGYEGAVTVTVDVLSAMCFRQLSETLKEQYNNGRQEGKEIHHHAIQEALKLSLREKYQTIYQGYADEGDTIYLNKIYTNLHVIQGAWEGFSEDYDERGQMSATLQSEETSIQVCDIFKPHPEKRIRTVLTQGIPGMGKTVCTQKFALSWAEGKENQDISLLFMLPFRELNPNIGEKDCSLMHLLYQFFPELKPLERLETRHKVLFIFDGLDETRLPLNFERNKVIRDETEAASLDAIVTNLIAGNLLGKSLIWITSRPAAVGRLPRKHVHQWTEVKGFTNEAKEEYFRRNVSDENLASRIISHVKSSRNFYIMCQIPLFCWITATVLTKMLLANEVGGMPNTLTEMYIYLLLRQTDQMMEVHYPEDSNNIVLKLAQLAFHQLAKGQANFYEADLRECGMDVKEATVYSGMCTKVFRKDGGRSGDIFRFVHLTVQEFLAAVHVHHAYLQRKENVFHLGYFQKITTKLLPKSLFSLHKTAIEKALESPSGHWDIFLRFLLGLSLKSNQELLARALRLEAEAVEDVAKTIQFIKEKIQEEPELKLNLFHCLSELKDESLVQEVQNLVSSGKAAPSKLSPVQWSALTFDLMTSEVAVQEFNLKNYARSEEALVRLQSVIISSSRALLDNCNLTQKSCDVLALGLKSAACHLSELDLSDNNLTDSGVKVLSDGLASPHCKVKILRLHKCNLKGYCFEALAVALGLNSSHLEELDLSANDFMDAGLQQLCVGLTSPHCVLQTLRLQQCKLKEDCCTDLTSVLNSGSSQLKVLDLSNNSLTDYGVSLLSDGLRSPNCRLESLRLNDCSLQKCCAALASVLSCGTSRLKELDLSNNELQDSEVNLLSAGLAAECCQLEILTLSFCGITDEGACDLASSLSTNPAHLRQLDLSYNYLQQDSWSKLSRLRQDNQLCKLQRLCVEPSARCYLLKNYACSLTLDTNTAAEFLFLHDGGKQATWVRERQSYPKHPDRFESVSQVLCRQALQHRHYWEVEWRGRWVDVAVAVRGIRRRAGSHLCGFGYTSQSWTLACFEDHYTAQHNHESVRIPAPPLGSHRVGVYLNCPGGTLSFYCISASGSIRHIYTFHSVFTEPLYPGFGMEEDDCSVTICTMEEEQANAS